LGLIKTIMNLAINKIMKNKMIIKTHKINCNKQKNKKIIPNLRIPNKNFKKKILRNKNNL
jgi:hypothetical protein